MKYIKPHLPSQINPQQVWNPHDITPASNITSNFEQWLWSQPPSVIRFITYMIGSRHVIHFESVDYLARKMGCSPSTVNRVIKLLRSNLCLAKVYRFGATNLYRISWFFKQKSIKKLVRQRLKQFSYVVSNGLMGNACLLLLKEINRVILQDQPQSEAQKVYAFLTSPTALDIVGQKMAIKSHFSGPYNDIIKQTKPLNVQGLGVGVPHDRVCPVLAPPPVPPGWRGDFCPEEYEECIEDYDQYHKVFA